MLTAGECAGDGEQVLAVAAEGRIADRLLMMEHAGAATALITIADVPDPRRPVVAPRDHLAAVAVECGELDGGLVLQ